ncbi:MAG: helix-turn-helix domain-containing protein [Bacteroidales bacterium]|nr:helix-turn-helix domain-containing protein [Bacteroidales bacterium]
MKKEISFNTLPEAVSRLSEQMEDLKRLFLENKKPKSDQDKLLTIHEAAEFLNLAVPSVYSMVSKRELPFMKKTKRLYFSRLELMEFIRTGRKKTKAEIEAEADQYLIKKKGDHK